MFSLFKLPRVAAMVLLVGALTAASAQPPCAAPAPTVKITKSNFVAANGANPPKADPQGTWDKPADGIDWRVEWSYGTKVDGKFKMNDTGVGGAKTLSGADNKTTGT